MAGEEHQPQPGRTTRISVVRTVDEFLRAASIRSIVYIDGQTCPYDEEFDGNDFCGMHLLGWVNEEAAACLRIRFFAGFAKMERLAVLRRFRRSTIAFDIVRFGLRLLARKGYRLVYGHARSGLETFWGRFGAQPMRMNRKVAFSGVAYTEMIVELAAVANVISLADDPYILIRPEGDWDAPGVLERGDRFHSVSEPGRTTAGGTAGWTSDTAAAWRTWAGLAARPARAA